MNILLSIIILREEIPSRTFDIKNSMYSHFRFLKNLLHLPTSTYYHRGIIVHILMVYQLQVRLMHSLNRVWFSNFFGFPAVNTQHVASICININAVLSGIVFCKYRSHRIESPYHSINHLLQKSEAFQSVHHVTFILCYNVLSDFFALVFALIRVRKHWRDDITQGKQ